MRTPGAWRNLTVDIHMKSTRRALNPKYFHMAICSMMPPGAYIHDQCFSGWHKGRARNFHIRIAGMQARMGDIKPGNPSTVESQRSGMFAMHQAPPLYG